MALVELEEAVDEAGSVIGRGAEFLEVGRCAAEDGVAHGRAELGDPVFRPVGDKVASASLAAVLINIALIPSSYGR